MFSSLRCFSCGANRAIGTFVPRAPRPKGLGSLVRVPGTVRHEQCSPNTVKHTPQTSRSNALSVLRSFKRRTASHSQLTTEMAAWSWQHSVASPATSKPSRANIGESIMGKNERDFCRAPFRTTPLRWSRFVFRSFSASESFANTTSAGSVSCEMVRAAPPCTALQAD